MFHKEGGYSTKLFHFVNHYVKTCEEYFVYESFCNSFAKNIYLCKL
jgi:hypothetical protein